MIFAAVAAIEATVSVTASAETADSIWLEVLAVSALQVACSERSWELLQRIQQESKIYRSVKLGATVLMLRCPATR